LLTKSKRDKVLISLLIPISIFYLSHTLLNQFLSQKNSELIEQKNILSSQLEIKKEHLGSIVDTNLNSAIKDYTDNIIQLEKEIKDAKLIKVKLIENMQNLNQKSLKWVEIVEFLVKDSSAKKIELFSIKNLETEQKINGIKEKLHIQVNGVGSFKNIYAFINSIEKNNIMLIVDNLTIAKDKDEKLNFRFNIKIWEFVL
jgi:hypothetical protein